MIINQIDIVNMSILKSKYDAPIGAHRDAPDSLEPTGRAAQDDEGLGGLPGRAESRGGSNTALQKRHNESLSLGKNPFLFPPSFVKVLTTGLGRSQARRARAVKS
jgi:hypothetical protein